MAEKDKRYYWLKLKRDFFKRHDIRIIESMPNGKDYILFYLKLLCESVDHEGKLRFSDEIPYNEDMLATITDTNVDVVRQAIKIFASLNFMELMDDGTYYMSKVSEMIGSETYWAERKRVQKARLAQEDFKNIRVISSEQIALPNGETRFIDEKRYGGNGKLVWERANCRCEICGSTDNLCIHHKNGYSNDLDDLMLVCRSCHRNLEEDNVGKFPIVSNTSPTCPSKSIEYRDKSIDKDKERKKYKRKKEVPPTIEEVRAYCLERGNNVDPERFVDYYGSQKWKKANGQPVADWKACVRTWEKNQSKVGANGVKLADKNDSTLDGIL